MNPLTSIPANVRVALYWIGYVLGMVTQITTGVWVAIAAASPEVRQPLWLIITGVVIALLQTQLNLLAGSNVPSFQDVVEGEVEVPIVAGEHRRDVERGAATLPFILGLVVLGALILWLVGALNLIAFVLVAAVALVVFLLA